MQTHVVKDDLMRTHHWLAPLFGLLVSLGMYSEVDAQPPYSETSYGPTTSGPTGSPYEADALYSPNLGYQSSGVNPDPRGMPPGFEPWPRISPYDNQYVQTRLERDGFWHQDIQNHGRRYFFGLDYLKWKPRAAQGGLLGEQGNPLGEDEVEFVNVPRTEISDRTVDTLLIDPFDVVRMSAPYGGEIGREEELDKALINERKGKSPSNGLSLNWGYFNPGGSGFEIDGILLGESNSYWSRGIGHPDRFNDSIDARITAMIPMLTDNDADGDGIPELAFARYDWKFQFQHETSTAGAGFKLYTDPFYSTDTTKISFFWGLQYLYLRENFDFWGMNSGATYVANPEGDPIPITIAQVTDPTNTILTSRLQSHLAGPQLGLRYEVGGESFRLYGLGALGIMANNEQLNLDGIGFGDQFDLAFDPNLQFQDRDASTHVSPMLKLNINAECAPFQYIPGLRRLNVLETAKLRAGYTLLYVGEVARPYDVIEWRDQPDTPFIHNKDRTDWYAHGWNLGLTWEY